MNGADGVPPRVEALLAEGVGQQRAGRADAAAQCYRQVLALAPAHSQARYLLALVDLESGRLAMGIERLEALVSERPELAQARFSLGRALRVAGRPEEALGHLDAALALAPGDVDGYLELASIHAGAGRPARAEEALRAALGLAPGHVGALNNLALLLAGDGRSGESRVLLERALELEPENPLTCYNLANQLGAGEEAERAIDLYHTALAARPEFAGAWHNLANLQLDAGRLAAAGDAYRRAAEAVHGVDAVEDADAPCFTTTSRTKLAHDAEQLRYLVDRGALDARYRDVATDYERALAALPAPHPGRAVVAIPPALRERLAPTYNRLVHWDPGERIAGAAVSPELDCDGLEREFRRNAPGYVVVDGLLAPRALAALRRFCLESTFWFTFRYAEGYLGAFMSQGFCCPLLLQIAEELRAALPGIFGSHRLYQMWAFKYDHRLSGIPIHADFAAVNVNFWITPDEASLDPDGGGLVVWDVEAPLEWDFAAYNARTGAIRDYLDASGARGVNVPHRQNRALVFNSNLFHESGPLRFRPGYENRRINVTMLFGRRGDSARGNPRSG